MWRRTHMIHANPANPRVATTRLLMSRGNTTAMVRTGLFMNEDGNVFSACMTREEELGRLLGGRKNEPLVPPAFITSAVLKVSLSHSAVVRMRAKARLLCKSNQVALPRIGISALCPGAGYAGRDGNRALPSPGRGNRAKPGTPGRSTRYPSIRHESGTRPVPTPLASSHRRSRQCQHYAMPL